MQLNRRTRLWAWGLVIVALSAVFLAPRTSRVEAQTTVAIVYFDDALSPYGSWVYDPVYGRVWRPSRISAGWRPYLHGRWVYTSEYGWIWVSEEPWGWVVYHYGYWAWSERYGWVWVPGDVWGPAWVEWCYGHGYVGWAPMPPDPHWQGAYYYGAYECTSPTYYSRAVYVRESNFASARVSAHVVLPSQNVIAARGTVNVTSYSRTGSAIANRSIDIKKLRAATGIAIKPVHVVRAKQPVAPGAFRNGQALRIYRPNIALAKRGKQAPKRAPLKLDPDQNWKLPSTSRATDTLPPPYEPPSAGQIGAPPPLEGPSLGSPMGRPLGGGLPRLGR